jgi:hypothetical protein
MTDDKELDLDIISSLTPEERETAKKFGLGPESDQEFSEEEIEEMEKDSLPALRISLNQLPPDTKKILPTIIRLIDSTRENE